MEFAKEHVPLNEGLAPKGEVLHALWQQALSTVQSLQSPLGVTASGPDDHFHAIFGRDSLWTVLLALEAGRLLQTKYRGKEDEQSASYFVWLKDLAMTVLRGLAHLQGQRVNDVNDEQPGRIVHEYWDPVPERMLIAHWPLIDGRYYGSFDASFLYPITMRHVHTFFQDDALLEELWPHTEAVLQWMLAWSDLDGDGLVEYMKRNPQGIGLDNQVWKDSGEALQAPGHQRLKHPVAWLEVQGYAWAAYAAYIELAQKRQCLQPALHKEIRQRMDRLQKGLERFWLEHEQFPAIALDGDKNPLPVVASNAGHLLWSQSLDSTRAAMVCVRLMQGDILTQWGLRTLSEQAYYYSPLKYHAGAIWPFDNAVVALGYQRYGFHAEARHIAEAVLQAIIAFEKPVELYTVQPSHWIRSHRIEQKWFLADYFSACSVQTWTAAAILYFTALLMEAEQG